MAFSPTTVRASRTRTQAQTQTQTQDESWKAQGFINIYFPGKGKDHKLVGVPLKESNELQAWMLELLNADAENLPKLVAKMKFVYTPVTAVDRASFSLD